VSVNDTAGRQPALLTEAVTAADFLESILSLVLPLIGPMPAQTLGTLQPATFILAMVAKAAPVQTLVISAKVARDGNVGRSGAAQALPFLHNHGRWPTSR